MDVYEIFIRYKEGELPTPKDIYSVFVGDDVRAMELIALMYAEKNKKIDMQEVFSFNQKKCEKAAKTMLTPLVAKNACLTGGAMESVDTQRVAAAFDTSCNIKSGSPTTQEPPQPKEPPLPLVGNTRNYVADCNDFFLYKSKTRVETMVNIFGATSSMAWVKAVASKIDTSETFDSKTFELLNGKDRHVHVSGNRICLFLNALSGNAKSFSWSMTDKKVIHLAKCRKALAKLAPANIEAMAVLLCSIGLPTFKLYTPATFIEHWKSYRFKLVSNGNLVKLALRPLIPTDGVPNKEEIRYLLEQYSTKTFSIREQPTTPDLFMFKHWYSYPPRIIVEHLADNANAIKTRCTGI